MRDWETQLTEADRELYERRTYGARQAFRARPALLIVDVTRSFVGSHRMPLLEAIEEYPTSCGERGWDALPHIRTLLEAGRRASVPVVFTRAADFLRPFAASTTKSENPEAAYTDEHAQDFPELTAPLPNELVIDKAKASAFFGTPLEVCLRHMGVDSLIVAGTTTSGCVRASVVDGHSFGFTMFVVEEGCFDRFESAHRANLFDMNAKYATVISLTEAVDYLDEVVSSSGAASHPDPR
jgi:maleamate amidohydrolase